MEKTSLFRVLQSFSKRDIRKFRKFLHSPYHNQRQDVIRLFGYLIQHIENAPQRQAVYQHLFPNRTFKEQELRYIMSYLMKNIKQYFALEAIQQDKFVVQHHLIQSLKQRGLESFFLTEWSMAIQALEETQLKNATYFYQKYQLYWEKLEFTQIKRRSGDLHLQAISDGLTVSYVIQLLWLACTMLVHQTMGKRIYELKLLEDILIKIERGEWHNNPPIMVFYYAYQSLSQPDSMDYFHQFSQMLNTHATKFSQAEAADIYKLAINFCIRRFNRGEESFAKEALNLYQSGLENRVFLQNGLLSRFTYNNVVLLGLRLKAIEWVKKFLDDYRPFLPAKERENTYLYNLAIYYYRIQQYDKVFDLLQQTKFKEKLYNLDARRMIARIYYERQDLDALESHLDSFRVYIHRLKDIGYHKEIYLNFIKFLKKLLYLNKQDKTDRLLLKKEIETASVVAEKDWLLKQVVS